MLQKQAIIYSDGISVRFKWNCF